MAEKNLMTKKDPWPKKRCHDQKNTLFENGCGLKKRPFVPHWVGGFLGLIGGFVDLFVIQSKRTPPHWVGGFQGLIGGFVDLFVIQSKRTPPPLDGGVLWIY